MNVNIQKRVDRVGRAIRYLMPMPDCTCILPEPKSLINDHVHRIPIDIQIPRGKNRFSHQGLELRLIWIHENGEEFYGGQSPIKRISPEQSSIRVIIQSTAPNRSGRYALAVYLVRGRRCMKLSQSECCWPIIPLSESDGNCYYGEYMIGLDASTKCNLECIFCLRVFMELLPEKQVTAEEIDRLAKEAFDGCSGISLSLGAEPLLNTEFDKLIDLLNAYPYVHTTMTSNGLTLSNKITHLLVEKGYKEISISMDGATKETYESIRKGARFETLIRNLQRLKQLKETLRSPYPRVRFHFALMRRNIAEIPAFVDLVHELGGELIRFQHFIIPHESLTQESLWFDKETSNRFLTEGIEKCKQYGIAIDAPPLFDLNTVSNGRKRLRTSLCHWPWKGMLLDPQGGALPCCQWKGPLLGNVNEQGFEAVWNGEGYRQLRRDWISGNLNDYCRNCSALMEGDVNDFSSFFASEYEEICHVKPPTSSFVQIATPS